MKPVHSILLATAFATIVANSSLAQQPVEDDRAKVGAILDNATTAAPPPAETDEDRLEKYKAEFETERKDSITELSKTLLTRTRQQDPFGVALRTPIKDVVLSPEDAARASQEELLPSSAFENAIRGITVGAINSNKKEFLIGSDNFYEGDAFDMQFQGQTFRVWIKEVTDEYIVFLDQQSSTVAELRLNFMTVPPPKGKWGAAGTTSEMPTSL